MSGYIMVARKNGKRNQTKWMPIGYVTEAQPITATTHIDTPLTREQADALRGEIEVRLTERSEEVWKRMEDAILHGTAQQRQARTRAQVRANLTGANESEHASE